ncbi:hypothetical protein LCGC14_0387870 [marine sediment metagenome]|uniref:Uncharacterized protein n=1 Tax=marine sediment metagenome TaxID=412755 RepID=A0A0F9T0H8_9ZZZZ
MTKQEKIREGLISKVKSIRLWATNPEDPLSVEDDADDILNFLHSQGVVIKVEDQTIQVSLPADGKPSGLKVPYHLSNLGEHIVAVESLIEEN